MAKLVETYSDGKFVQTVSAQIPWFHNIAKLFYIFLVGEWYG